MVPKSRRNRRSVLPNPPPSAAANPAAYANRPVAAASTKPATVESFVTTANFARDLKWTSIVTLIIAVLIVVALIVIPH
jgi:hypothetical protein